MAKLYFNYGAMGCGKTRELLRVRYNYIENGKDVLVMKSVLDTRGDTKVTSRDNNSVETDFLIHQDDNVYEIISRYIEKNTLNCILIDEAQFLSEEHVIQLTDIVDLLNIPVICYGLKADFQNKLFPGSAALFVYADESSSIKTICSSFNCDDGATMNIRFEDGSPVFEGEQIAIDGEMTDAGKNITYKPMCRRCRRTLVRKINRERFIK